MRPSDGEHPVPPSTRRRIEAVRVLAGVACVLLLGVAVVLMLADRAPGALRTLSDRIDQSERSPARVAAEAPIPQSDFLVHVVVWGAVTATAGVAAWAWRRLPAVAFAVLSLSMVVELSQDHLTHSRTTQLTDATANVVGVTAGVALAAGCYLVTAAGRSAARAEQRRDRAPRVGAAP
jgi:hypothetical protein